MFPEDYPVYESMRENYDYYKNQIRLFQGPYGYHPMFNNVIIQDILAKKQEDAIVVMCDYLYAVFNQLNDMTKRPNDVKHLLHYMYPNEIGPQKLMQELFLKEGVYIT